MRFSKFAGLALAGVLACAAAVSSASANVITIGGGAATITCTPNCKAIVGGSIVDQNGPGLAGTAGSLSSTLANLYAFSPSNEAEEARALNVLANTSFSTGTQTDTASARAISFSSSAAWLALKIGNLHFFVFNPTTGSLTIAYAANSAMAGGLSHYTEFGQVVPIPASLWLMVSALAGLGFASKRRKGHA